MQEKILVTGATGFIGGRLVRKLVSSSADVYCLIRPSSNADSLIDLGCTIIRGDLSDETADWNTNSESFDTVYHLAASTHAIRSGDLVGGNKSSTRNLFNLIANHDYIPRVVCVSSIAAVGPCRDGQPLLESTEENPVSNYGKSKLASEKIAREFADHFPISIVRPPIVLGEGDVQGFEMFRSIAKTGWHFCPGFAKHQLSVIHVDDLVATLIKVAESGERLSERSPSDGVYFCAADETFTYAELGKLIGQAMGRERTRTISIPAPFMWFFGACNEAAARFTNSRRFLNLDKMREAFAGSWVCSNEKINRELGASRPQPFFDRLQQTVAWYRTNHWLPEAGTKTQPVRSAGSSRIRGHHAASAASNPSGLSANQNVNVS